MSMRKESLIEQNVLLFLNNYLHVAKRRKLNNTYEPTDKSQMSFAERIVLYSLLMERKRFYEQEPHDERVSNESWSRLGWLLSELKEIADLNEFTAQVSFTDYLAQKVIASTEKVHTFFKLERSELAEKLKAGQREFPVSYGTVLSLSATLPTLREKEFHYLQKKHTDFGDSHDYYLFTEGCIDLCLIRNAPKLVPLFQAYLGEYLNLFKSTETRWDVNIFTWEKQHELVREILTQRCDKFGSHFWLQPDDLQAIDTEYGSELRLIDGERSISGVSKR
jgi:hypothetical protein